MGVSGDEDRQREAKLRDEDDRRHEAEFREQISRAREAVFPRPKYVAINWKLVPLVPLAFGTIALIAHFFGPTPASIVTVVGLLALAGSAVFKGKRSGEAMADGSVFIAGDGVAADCSGDGFAGGGGGGDCG
jgi:hypothetical protein